jgi:hypothetical protein
VQGHVDQKTENVRECRTGGLFRAFQFERVSVMNFQVAPPPGDFHELYKQVVSSPAKHYFFLMFFMVVGSIFVVGIFFGRALKRQQRTLKNK